MSIDNLHIRQSNSLRRLSNRVNGGYKKLVAAQSVPYKGVKWESKSDMVSSKIDRQLKAFAEAIQKLRDES